MERDDNYIPEIEGSYDDELCHVGVSKKDGAKVGSGRFPLGSGENPYQHLEGHYGEYRKLYEKGFTDGQIAEAMGISTGVLRARNAWYKALKDEMKISKAVELLDKGYTKTEIAQKMGCSPTTVTNMLEASSKVREAKIISTRNALKERIDKVGWVDTGKGTEAMLGVKRTMLDDAVITLQDEGYQLYSNVRVRQGGTDNFTTIRALAKPGMSYADVLADKGNPKAIMTDVRSRDGGLTFNKKGPPVNVKASRVEIRYADDPISGVDMDGVIELRRGVPDLDLGKAHYAQVRIGIDVPTKENDGKFYAKGMAVYADDLPDGVDIRVNSNKPRSKGITGALKPQKHIDGDDSKPIDQNDPFGTNTKEEDRLMKASNYYIDPKTGERKQSSLNFVNEEGNWDKWDKTLPSQFLGKQPPKLAKQQLDIDATKRELEFKKLMALTNPVLRESLLEDFGNKCDSAATNLKAASLPSQATATIIPSRSLKPNEIYAPRLDDGEEVILVRFPHEGIFQIPRLVVNNKNRESKNRISSQAADAVCINPKTAEIMSGADFDGDTVLVIPTKQHGLQNRPPLEGLKGFDAKEVYATTPERRAALKIWKKGSTQEGLKMGTISNLITDMTFQKATDEELTRAVKYANTIIDTAKHKLDYKRSFEENRIAELHKKYQGKSQGGAATLLSRATHDVEVEGVKSYRPYDETGERRFLKDNTTVPVRKKTGEINPETGKPIYETVGYKPKTRTFSAMDLAKDAYDLTSGGSRENPGTETEKVYAEYANRMKALGNEARKAAYKAKYDKQKPNRQAAEMYAPEVAHLKAQILECKKNAPIERKAQAIAQANMERVRQNWTKEGGMTKDEYSKGLDRELKRARVQLGAKRVPVEISPKEWEAIQAGAISATDQKELFRFADKDKLLEYAMPRTQKKLSKSFVNQAQGMLDRGYTLKEVADRFDIAVSTLSNALNE